MTSPGRGSTRRPPLPLVVEALELVTFRADVPGSPLETALRVPLGQAEG